MDQDPVNVAAKIEPSAVASWPARETKFLSGWLLRFSGGQTHRGNSVATHAFDEAAPAAAIEAVERAYRSRGLPAMFQITPATKPPELEQILQSSGYERITPTCVCIARTDRTRSLLPQAGDVSVDDTHSRAFDDLVASGSRSQTDAEERLSILARLTLPRIRVIALADDEAVACGVGVLAGGMVGINLMRTAPAHRRRGHASRVLAAIAHWAALHDSSLLYLSVEERNAPARALYARAGFNDAYACRYYRKA